MHKSVKAVVLDYGNVLTLPPLSEHVQSMQELCKLEQETFLREYCRTRPDFDRGTIDGVEYWSRILKANSVSPTAEKIKDLIAIDIKSWTRIRLPMLRWAQELGKSGLKTAILSNMPPDLLIYINEKFSWLEDFDALVFSCQVGMIKPEPGIYEYCLQTLALKAGEVLFLDDSRENVRAAARLGINTLLFQSLEQTVRTLARRYLLPRAAMTTATDRE